jgi:hypothetical protein
MQLIYFDEVKDDNEVQDYFWLGAIAINVQEIQAIERQVSEISERVFGSAILSADTEFHAAEIYHRKKLFKAWNNPAERVNLIGELLRLLNDKEIYKIFVQVRRDYFKAKFSAKKIDELAFMFLCEKCDSAMAQLGDIGMLIGDRDSTSLASRYAGHLSNWRHHRTDYNLGAGIKHLIDTVHFTESHLSRMLQLADIHIWCRQFRSLNHAATEPVKKLMADAINDSGDALSPKKYKQYPLGG